MIFYGFAEFLLVLRTMIACSNCAIRRAISINSSLVGHCVFLTLDIVVPSSRHVVGQLNKFCCRERIRLSDHTFEKLLCVSEEKRSGLAAVG